VTRVLVLAMISSIDRFLLSDQQTPKQAADASLPAALDPSVHQPRRRQGAKRNEPRFASSRLRGFLPGFAAAPDAASVTTTTGEDGTAQMTGGRAIVSTLIDQLLIYLTSEGQTLALNHSRRPPRACRACQPRKSWKTSCKWRPTMTRWANSLKISPGISLRPTVWAKLSMPSLAEFFESPDMQKLRDQHHG
jgi:hypothetical protein